ncbi:MAG TPA: hypothetical protein ENN29_03465 [Candidatus Hydrogenedentes bacterium]|nr:hypothetical protein [Candidatus Hydrogenedentota bacterium]
MNDIRLFDLPDLTDRDFTKHNDATKALWKAFDENTHTRVPVRFGTNPRMLMQDPAYNTNGVTYQEYMSDPELMGQGVLEWLYWSRFLLPGDDEKGLPEYWQIHIDFENIYDAAWFGAPIYFHDDQVPYAAPMLQDDNKRMLFDKGIPDSFAGEWAARALQFIAHFEKKSKAGWTFLGRPVKAPDAAPFMGTDGAFTAAAALRGATALCADLLLDPDYVEELLDYLTDAIIARMKAWRNHFGQPEQMDNFGTADDSVEMLSAEQYRHFVLPRHRRLYEAFGAQGKRGIHLCGNAQRLFPVLKNELNVTEYDTGFPIDFALFRKEMGTDVLIAGGPAAPFFVEPTPEALLRETERILKSGILDGGRFILREGNNLPPRTPLANCAAFYALGSNWRIPR